MTYSDPTQTPRALTIELPLGFSERLLSEPIARSLETVLRPYRIALEIGAHALRANGDEIAVMLTQRLFERAAERFRADPHMSGKTLKDIAEAAVADALRHDLAMRLHGLHHALRPMSLSQVAFVDMLLHSDRPLLFGIGPTGTGKTHLAVAAGLSLLAEERVKQLVLTRPYVLLEGEVWTPALREEKRFDDHLTPLEDELHELLGPEEVKRLKDSGRLLVTPLGRMRGRTFNDACIVLDEAQNMTVSKMRMAVTRMGTHSRTIITGNPAHADLHSDEPSGLEHLLRLVANADFVAIHTFEPQQIIRHDAVAKIEALYAGQSAGMPRAA